jgi:uncharacterized coiled-coil protein SlyX
MEPSTATALFTYGPLGIGWVVAFFIIKAQRQDNQGLQAKLVELNEKLATQAIESRAREEQRAAEQSATILKAANAVADSALVAKETKEAVNNLTRAVESRKASNPAQKAVAP